MPLKLLSAFLIASFTLYFLYPIAIKAGFVDRPTARKIHHGEIPLIGGISIFIPIALLLHLYPNLIPNSQTFICCGALFLLIGLIDDKFDLSVSLRILLISMISFWLVSYTDIKIHHLGDLLGNGDVGLNNIETTFNIIAIIGAVTAFNMVDGLDGLLGGLALVSLMALGALFSVNEQYDLLLFCGVVMAAILPYVCCNLEMLPKKKMKVFMGDSGSLFIGFTLYWLIVEGSQMNFDRPQLSVISPVTVLWVIAIPLMDMAYTMLRRIRKKQSPFKADREHIHHVCGRLGLSPLRTLFLICLIALFFASIGIFGEVFNISEKIMFMTFIVAFIGYYLCFTYIWKVTVMFRHFNRLFN